MPLHPSLFLVFFALMGIATACIAMLLGLLWARVRSLPVEETTFLVEHLARRQESIEGLLSQLEAGKEPVTGGATASPGAGPESMPSHSHRIDQAAATAVNKPTLIAVPSLAASVAETSAEAAVELGRRFGAIWALADAGEPAEAIARTIGQPIGQVELILGLRRQLSTSQASPPGGRA
jgi:hypothetical protein